MSQPSLNLTVTAIARALAVAAVAVLVLASAGAFAQETTNPKLRELQSRKLPKPITEVVSAIQGKMEEAGGKCYITVSYYPEGEGHHSGVGNCTFALSDKPSALDRVAKGVSFIPLVGSLVSLGVSATSDAIKDKEKEAFVSTIRFEAIGTAKGETTLRMRAFTARQKMLGDEAYYKELFSKIADSMQCQVSELTLNDIEQ